MKLATAKQCKALARDCISNTYIFHTFTEIDAVKMNDALQNSEVILLDWSEAEENGDNLIVLSVNEAGSAEYSFFEKRRLVRREVLRLMQFRSKSLIGLLAVRPRYVHVSPRIRVFRENIEYGMFDVQWYDILDRATGLYLEFDDFFHCLSRQARIPSMSYHYRGPLSVAAVKETFEKNPKVTKLRVRQLTSSLGPDGRRVECIIPRSAVAVTDASAGVVDN